MKPPNSNLDKTLTADAETPSNAPSPIVWLVPAGIVMSVSPLALLKAFLPIEASFDDPSKATFSTADPSKADSPIDSMDGGSVAVFSPFVFLKTPFASAFGVKAA